MTVAVKTRDRSARAERRWQLSMPQLWGFVAVGLPVVASLAAGLSTVDLAYQLRAGLSMLATHALPRVDTFTFTVRGEPWLDQQWGAQVLLALAFKAGGWPGLVVLRAAVIGGIFGFVYASCRAAGADLRRAAGLTIVAFALASPGLNLRPQLFAVLLFTFIVWIVVRRGEHPEWMVAIPFVTVVWANLHGSFFLAPLLLALAWLEDRSRAPATARRAAILAGVSLAATLVNPFGPRVWSYVVDLSTSSVITRFISEWEPPTIRTYAGAAFFISVAVVSVLLARRSQSVGSTSLVYLGVFFAIALQAQRGIVWWACAVPPALAAILRSPARAPRAEERRPINTAIAAVLVLIGVVLAPWWHTSGPPGGRGGVLSFAPPGITRELGKVLDPGDRLFASQAWASWFEFQFRRNPVAVDARIELFPASLWQSYSDVSNGRDGWQSILDRWDVDVLVANREQQVLLLPAIRRDTGWRLVYEDADGAIFVPSSSATDAVT